MKSDIQNRADIEILVNAFYANLTQNDEMKPFFEGLDWEHHLPRMIGFWDFILFSTPGAYTGSMMSPHFQVHEKTPIVHHNFKTWISIFDQTVDELFEGNKADDAKNAAFNIGATIKYKMLGSESKK